jgi:tetratricopeptide (TPR) repeat protein
MAIKGSLKEASLPDVLQLLALGQKTGCLSIADRNNFGYIYFDRGRISYASIVNRRDRLGDILVKAGKLRMEQLEAAIARQERERDRRLGQILIAEGMISRADLERYMRLQIEEAVYFLFTWAQGTFNFESDVRPDHEEFLVSINPESLLLEGARRVDEWSLIEKKIPSFDLIFSVETDRLQASEVELTPEQAQIFPLIDGKRDVTSLTEDSGLVEFDVGKALYGLISAGFAHRVGRSQAPKVQEVNESRIQEHRNLGIAFYKTGMLDEAAREFRRVSDLRSNDGSAHFYLGLVALRQARWRDAEASLLQAAELLGARPGVLHNLALAHEQLGTLDRADSAYGDAASRARHDPRILTGWGIAALQRGDFQVAEGRLDRAREVSGDQPMPALWYWGRALAAAGQDAFEQAEALLQEGLERHPRHPILVNNLAVLAELAGDAPRAEELLRTALADEPAVPQLSKNLGDLLYRSGRYDDAASAYARAVRLQPDLGDDVYFKLGNIAYRRGDREQAASYWKQALGLNPSHELARTNLDTLSALV